MKMAVLFLILSGALAAQTPSSAGAMAELVNNTNAKGMLVLGGWAQIVVDPNGERAEGGLQRAAARHRAEAAGRELQHGTVTRSRS
jgi:hypothetical protein